MKKIILILTIIFCSISSSAITFEEFIAKCDSIYGTPAIKLSADSIQELRDEKVDQVTVFKTDSISENATMQLLAAISTITETENMLVVKHNSDEDGNVLVYILPNGNKLKLLVAIIHEKQHVIVNLIGDIELLDHDNLVNIGGKDIVKEALKEKGQKQELNK